MKFSKSVMWSLASIGLTVLIASCSANPVGTQETVASQDQPQAIDWSMEDEKRAWQNLHGGWGKRGWQDMNGAWGKRAWNNLHGGWGKRGWQDMNGAWGKRAWNNLHGGWGKRAWSNLHGGWGKRDADLLELLAASQNPSADQDYVEVGPMDSYASLRQVLNSNMEKLLENEPEHDADKRSWSSLHGTWGKRSGEKWSNLRGAWGKREPGWNNLKGLWGKRSSMDSILDDSQSAFLDRPEE